MFGHSPNITKMITISSYNVCYMKWNMLHVWFDHTWRTNVCSPKGSHLIHQTNPESTRHWLNVDLRLVRHLWRWPTSNQYWINILSLLWMLFSHTVVKWYIMLIYNLRQILGELSSNWIQLYSVTSSTTANVAPRASHVTWKDIMVCRLFSFANVSQKDPLLSKDKLTKHSVK